MIPASDRTVQKNHNAPPKAPRQPDANHARLFLKIVKMVAVITEQEADLIALKRQPERIRFARMISFWLAGGCDELEPVIPQVELAAITGIYRKTIADDVDQLRTWRERNTFFREITDMLADALGPFIGATKFAGDMLDEASEEFLADRAARKAIQTVRAAANALEAPRLRLVGA